MKYTADTTKVRTLEEVQTIASALIKSETGATAEVTITPDTVLVYTEDLDKVDEIQALMAQASREFVSISQYDADENFPAGATLKFRH